MVVGGDAIVGVYAPIVGHLVFGGWFIFAQRAPIVDNLRRNSREVSQIDH